MIMPGPSSEKSSGGWIGDGDDDIFLHRAVPARESQQKIKLEIGRFLGKETRVGLIVKSAGAPASTFSLSLAAHVPGCINIILRGL